MRSLLTEAPADCFTMKLLPLVSRSSSVAAHAALDLDVHTNVVVMTLFSSTRVVARTEPSPWASVRVCTMEALPGNMRTVEFTTVPAPGGVTLKPTRPAERW